MDERYQYPGKPWKVEASPPFPPQRARYGSLHCLLPESKRNKVMHTFNYRADDSDLDRFEAELDAFVRVIDYARTRYVHGD